MGKRLTDVAETPHRAEVAQDEARVLSSTAGPLDRIEQMKAGVRDRAAELSARQIAGPDAGLALRAREIRTDILRAEIDRDLPGLFAGSRENGALDQLLRLAERIADEDILPDARQGLQDRIAPPALRTSDEYVTALIAEVEALPVSLQGLADARRIGASLALIVDAMRARFGVDLLPRVQPLHLRRAMIVGDPAVLGAFRQLLADVPSGRGGKEAVRAAASQYLDEAATQRLPNLCRGLRSGFGRGGVARDHHHRQQPRSRPGRTDPRISPASRWTTCAR